ncbi:tRNA acetyltransferase TAN1 [Cytospora mali]|uniref:tRNA acetyltransferase TAN1 n=1 Tax=Cytospora mali TaxID=578113 RepID=A0A194W690_CYTMA|nr:tRNA acetyltransferase TAN1 [Valsa mali]
MADSKRKAGNDAGGAAYRKKKKGNNGKWMVPKGSATGSEKPKANTIEPGDMGIWVTCPLHMKGKSAREMELLFDEYAEKVYGIKSEGDDNGSDDEDEDIEAAIKKEIGTLQDKGKGKGAVDHVFTEVRIKEECLLFMRCKAPVEPVEFSRRICQDAASVGHAGAKSRYLNRLTPVTVIVKATESGLEEGARKVLADFFKLKSTEPKEGTASDGADNQSEAPVDEADKKAKPATYAIRPSIRSHNTLKRDNVIARIADLIDDQHKVNLGAPDKVILVDIYQTVCGFSVVPGDWEQLKRYNLTELYKLANSDKEVATEGDKGSGNKPASATQGA